MNDWHCHKGYAGEGTRCTHPECCPIPDELGDTAPRHDQPLAQVRRPAESLIKAMDLIISLQAQIETANSEIEKYTALRTKAQKQLAARHADAAPALESLAAAFGWSYRELRMADPFDEEEDDHA